MSKERAQVHIPNDPKPSPNWVVVGLSLWLLPPLGVVLLLRRGYLYYKRARLRTFRRYRALINNTTARSLSIVELANTLGRSREDVRRDLNDMLGKGYLDSSAYLDSHSDTLILAPGGQAGSADGFMGDLLRDLADKATHFTQAFTQAMHTPPEADPSWAEKTEKAEKTETTEEPSPMGHVSTPPPKKDEDVDLDQTLRKLKDLNDHIAHEGVSQRIDRIGNLTANILQQGQVAGRDAEMRKFMGYYLPTTLKLLESYALLEAQSYQGSNILSARADIERILDTVIQGFEQQLDRLFSTDALDISSDISVLEQMLASDGLAGGARMQPSPGVKAQGGH